MLFHSLCLSSTAENPFAIRITSEFMYLNVNMRPSYLHKFSHTCHLTFVTLLLRFVHTQCGWVKWVNGQVYSIVAQVNCLLSLSVRLSLFLSISFWRTNLKSMRAENHSKKKYLLERWNKSCHLMDGKLLYKKHYLYSQEWAFVPTELKMKKRRKENREKNSHIFSTFESKKTNK